MKCYPARFQMRRLIANAACYEMLPRCLLFIKTEYFFPRWCDRPGGDEAWREFRRGEPVSVSMNVQTKLSSFVLTSIYTRCDKGQHAQPSHRNADGHNRVNSHHQGCHGNWEVSEHHRGKSTVDLQSNNHNCTTSNTIGSHFLAGLW